MNYSTYYKPLIRKIYADLDSAKSGAAHRARERLPEIPFEEVAGPMDIPEADRTGTTIYLGGQKGAPVTRCPGTNGHVCCNYLTVELYSGCPIGCTYCIMRSYLNFSPVSVVTDTAPLVAEIRRVALANPDSMVRVGSGETGDSLLYDPLFELSREIVESVADLENVFFEMKTKTNAIDHLLSISRKGNGVIGFSVAPQTVIDDEEGSAASLEERFIAARRASEAGFRIAFHFDPMFFRPDWREIYTDVAKQLKRFANDRIAWISLGTFRFPPDLKDQIGGRPYLFEELVPSRDGKYRYVQRVRREMYSQMRKAILAEVTAPVYLCMESEAVWNRSFGTRPEALASEASLFDEIDLGVKNKKHPDS